MSYGYTGKIAKIDLSTKQITVDTHDEYFYRSYMGGSNIGAYYMLKEMKPGVDPLSPDNMLVLSTSVVTGIPSPGFSRYNANSKSPLTGCFGDSQAGGFWGAELKFAGYDALVIKGRAEAPCYVFIKDGNIEIKAARHLWGKDTKKTQEIIRKENSDPRIRVLAIGRGGENLVRFANLISDLNHANGRNGHGAVMGSKNLKAVAVRGSAAVPIKDRATINAANRYFRDNVKDNPATRDLNLYGTSSIVVPMNLAGMLPSYNFRTGYFEHAEKISGETMTSTILTKNEGCYACPVKCKRVVRVQGQFATDPAYGGPEYETVASFGSNCGVDNLAAVAYANQLCSAYSIDTISTGSAIAFAMECYENGILSKKNTDGLDLKFGNAKAMVEMVKKIANREGLGDVLAEGVKRAAEKIGKGAERYAMHVKGQELPMHEPRAKGMLGISYACSPIGADHVVVEHDTDFDFNAPEIFVEQAKALALLERLETNTIDEKKIRQFCYLQDHFSFADALCICVLAHAPVRVFKMKHIVEIVSATTGWETSLWEIMKTGEKRINLAKCFNAREGFDVKDDILPNRMYEGLETGARKGDKIDRENFKYAQKLYYRMRNWDERAIPTKAILHELDLAWVIDNLESSGVKLNL